MRPSRAAFRRSPEFPPRSPPGVEPHKSPRRAIRGATPAACPRGSGGATPCPTASRAVHQLLVLAAPGPCLGHRERPQADVERPDVRPDEPHLLLARPDDLLALAEGDLQAEP